MKNNNLPNILTIIRMILTPILVLLMMASAIPFLGIFFSSLAFVLFIGIALTDYFDGKIARETGNVTNFGKLFDPISDKIFVFSVLIMFVAQNKVPGLLVILLLAREIVVLGVKQLLLEKEGQVVAASNLAKYKTIARQMLGLTLIFLVPRYVFGVWLTPGYLFVVNCFTTVILLPSLFLSYISMFEYVKRAKEYLKDDISNLKQ